MILLRRRGWASSFGHRLLEILIYTNKLRFLCSFCPANAFSRQNVNSFSGRAGLRHLESRNSVAGETAGTAGSFSCGTRSSLEERCVRYSSPLPVVTIDARSIVTALSATVRYSTLRQHSGKRQPASQPPSTCRISPVIKSEQGESRKAIGPTSRFFSHRRPLGRRLSTQP